MSEITGTWDCSVDTPVGLRTFIVEITSSEDQFQALVKGNFGELHVSDGKFSGGVMTWTMAVKTPLPMKLDCTAEVSGDTMNGSVSAGIFGKYPLRGARR